MVTGCVIVGQPCSMSEMTLPARAAPSSSIRRGQNKPGYKGLCFMLNKNRISSLFAASRYFTVAGLVVAFWANAATAAGSCQGTYAATLLQPLPAQVVVGLDIRDRSPRNLQLAERFLTGIRDAGIVVGAQPNVLLHVSISQLGGVSSRQSRGAEQSDLGIVGHSGRPPTQFASVTLDRTYRSPFASATTTSVSACGCDGRKGIAYLMGCLGAMPDDRLRRRPVGTRPRPCHRQRPGPAS